MGRELQSESILRLQSEYYRLDGMIEDARRSQRQICEELLYRAEEAQTGKRSDGATP